MRDLETFFNIITRFNRMVPIENTFTSTIENYFMYRWENDRSLALTSDEDCVFLD